MSNLPMTGVINNVGVMLTSHGGLTPEGIIELAAQKIAEARREEEVEYARLLRGRDRRALDEFLDKKDIDHREQAIAYGHALREAFQAQGREFDGSIDVKNPGIVHAFQQLFSHWKNSIRAYGIRGWRWLDDISRFYLTAGPEIIERPVDNDRFVGIEKIPTGGYNINLSTELGHFITGDLSDHGILIKRHSTS